MIKDPGTTDRPWINIDEKIDSELVSEERILLHRGVDLLTYALDDLVVLRILEHFVDEVGDEVHHVLLGAACGHGSGTQADA